jgi:integrase
VQFYASKVGLSSIRFHGFRHGCASNLLKGGMPVRLVAKWLGDNESTVMDVYSHSFPSEKKLLKITWINCLHPLKSVVKVWYGKNKTLDII